MVKIINSEPSTLQSIESPETEQEHRTYLGMSMIGHHCSRYIWYSFRWAYQEKFSARMIRLFNRGHREEPEIIKALASVGVNTHSEQAEFITGWGHIKGHCDGMCEGVLEAPKTTHLAEFKTMADKYFKKVSQLGVRSANPQYYGQCQIGMLGFELTRALFVAVNKNDDSYYIERIKYQPGFAADLLDGGKGIILSPEPPPRIYKSTWYQCKFCSARFTCHFGEKLRVSCRTCTKLEVAKFGKMVCGKTGEELDRQQQQDACEAYDPINNS